MTDKPEIKVTHKETNPEKPPEHDVDISEDLLAELEEIDAKARKQGHSLAAVLQHAAHAAFGIDV